MPSYPGYSMIETPKAEPANSPLPMIAAASMLCERQQELNPSDAVPVV